MPKRKAKKTIRKAVSSAGGDSIGVEAKNPKIDKQAAELTDPDVERQIYAIKAIRDVQIEHLLTELRMIRSYFNKQQLQTPALQFFEQNFPTLSLLRNGEHGQLDVQCNIKDGNASLNDERDLRASLLSRLSVAYSDCSAAVQPFSGFELSNKTDIIRSVAGKARILAADNMQIKDFVLEEPSDIQLHGMQDALQTPGAYSQRMSFGMTPKTVRLPKPGEMLLSVHGSPLGVYKEENMEAIHESEEGCPDIIE